MHLSIFYLKLVFVIVSLCFHCLSDVFFPSRFISARFGYSFADSLNVFDCPIHNILSIIHILSIITLYKYYYNYIHKNIDFIYSAQKCFTSLNMKYQVIEHTFSSIISYLYLMHIRNISCLFKQ